MNAIHTLGYGLFFMIAACIIVACDPDARDRRNPLDSENPVTGGRPQNLRALGNNEHVGLSWASVALSDVVGYRLYRESGGVGARTDIFGSPPPNEFIDPDVNNEMTYVYRLSVLIGDDRDPVESPLSNPVVVTPGPETCWVVDDGLGRILKISADARAVSSQVSSVFGARHIALDPRDGAAWITTHFGAAGRGGVAIRFTAAGEEASVISGFLTPGSVAVDPSDGSVWIADAGTNGENALVVRATEEGIPLFRLTDFVKPSALAVDPASSACWVGDSGTRSITKLSGQSDILATISDMGTPLNLAVDPVTGSCWGIDSGSKEVFKLLADGTRAAAITGFSEPVRLAHNPVTDDWWVVDQGNQGVASAIIIGSGVSGTYDIQQDMGAHSVLPGLVFPMDVSIDSVNGNVWIADAGLSALIKYTPDGRETGRFSSLINPAAIVVDPGPRPITFIP